MLETMFGINASGKDSIAKVLQARHPDIYVTSESRLLMHHLGIISDPAAFSSVTQADYLALENTPQERIMEVTNGSYRQALERYSTANGVTLLLSHLVFMLHIDKAPVFLDHKDPPFPELSTGLVHVRADYEEILRRRIQDNASGARERNGTEMELIVRHQGLCDQKWAKITANRDAKTFVEIKNHDLDTAAAQVEEFIFRK